MTNVSLTNITITHAFSDDTEISALMRFVQVMEFWKIFEGNSVIPITEYYLNEFDNSFYAFKVEIKLQIADEFEEDGNVDKNEIVSGSGIQISKERIQSILNEIIEPIDNMTKNCLDYFMQNQLTISQYSCKALNVQRYLYLVINDTKDK